MAPPSPPPPSSSNGEKSSQRRPVTQSPILLRIDASDQGFHSGGTSPLDSSPISFQLTQSTSTHHNYPGGVPVQVTARLSSPKAHRPNSNSGNYSSSSDEVHHHHHQSPYHHQQQNSYQQPHYPQQIASPGTTFVALPGQATTILQPMFASPATTSVLPPQQATHYYTGHPQAAYPTMVPFHMPGGYAVAGFTPAMISPAGSGGGALTDPIGGEMLMDPMMASHYQVAQYHAMMQQYMQHSLNMQQQSPPFTTTINNNTAAGGGGGNGNGRYRGGSGSSSSSFYQNQYQTYQNQQHSGMGSYSNYHGNNQPIQSSGNGDRGSGGSMSSSYSNSYPNNMNSNNNNDIALPGVSEGPEAEIFQAAIRESGNLNSRERASGGNSAGGLQGEGNEFLLWVRKTLVSLDGGLSSSPPTGNGTASGFPTSSSSLNLTLKEMHGNLVALSRDQIGSRVLQTSMEGMSEDDLKLIFEELEPKMEILIIDQFGNYVIQRLLESKVESIVISIGESLKGRVLPFSLHVYGCRVVQKCLDALPQDHRVPLAVELEPYTLHCLGDQNANHVIQKCLETVQPSDGIRPMLEMIAKHALTLARHSFGCRAVQRLLQYTSFTEIYDQVIGDVLSSILELTKNKFGNYVVQHLVSQGPDGTRNAIIEVILPLSASLACHKFASNVMETCLQQCPDNQRRALIESLIHSSDPLAPTVAGIARDQYGNYVLQRALEMADEEERSKLILELQPHLDSLRRSGYGKHIASRVGKMLVAIARQKQYQGEQKCVAPAVGDEEGAAKEEESTAEAADGVADGNEAAAVAKDNEEAK